MCHCKLCDQDKHYRQMMFYDVCEACWEALSPQEQAKLVLSKEKARDRTIPALVLCALLWGQGIASAESFPLLRCLDTIRQAESSGQDGAIGDGGQSRGAYQLQRGTWKRYSKLPWAKYAHDPKESRIVAGCYVSDIVRAAKRYHADSFSRWPLRVVISWYNTGHYVDPVKWHLQTKNKIYRSV